jgi:Aspartyl/Asparaginyl beta-hydroxylase
MTDTAAPAATWQRGYPLADLKAVAGVLDAHDHGLVLSKFTRTSERTIAEAAAAGQLYVAAEGGEPVAVVIARIVGSSSGVKDFSGAVRATKRPGDIDVQRFGCRADYAGVLYQLLLDTVHGLEGQQARLAPADTRPAVVWLQGWAEHPLDGALAAALGATWQATKIRASSELVHVWARGQAGQPLDAAEQAHLCMLPFEHLLDSSAAQLAQWCTTEAPTFADHYSVYGKGRTWGALALRGYAPPGQHCDPGFIIKPAEMAKAWKNEHADAMGWVPQWSELGIRLLPLLEPSLAQLPEMSLQRVRLMQLTPGGGELKRHADITDRQAGVQDGCVVRIHFPIVTNPDVVFTSWGLWGDQAVCSMAAGTAWYLDVRKPHTAVNGGATNRIHLVVDAEATPAMRQLLATAYPAPYTVRPQQAAVPAQVPYALRSQVGVHGCPGRCHLLLHGGGLRGQFVAAAVAARPCVHRLQFSQLPLARLVRAVQRRVGQRPHGRPLGAGVQPGQRGPAVIELHRGAAGLQQHDVVVSVVGATGVQPGHGGALHAPHHVRVHVAGRPTIVQQLGGGAAVPGQRLGCHGVGQAAPAQVVADGAVVAVAALAVGALGHGLLQRAVRLRAVGGAVGRPLPQQLFQGQFVCLRVLGGAFHGVCLLGSGGVHGWNVAAYCRARKR